MTEHSFSTVISFPQGHPFDDDWLEKSITKALNLDDVLHEDFLETILLTGPGSEQLSNAQSSGRLLRSVQNKWGVAKIRGLGLQSDLLPGPYIVVGGELWQVLRLYDDTQGAFLVPVRKSTDGRYVIQKL